MAKKRTQTDIATRKLVLKLYSMRTKMRKIGELVGRTHSTVQGIINKYCYSGLVQDQPGKKYCLKKMNDLFYVK